MFLSDVFCVVIRFSAAFFTVIRLNSIMTLASNQGGAVLYSKKLQINFECELSVMVKIIPDFGSSDSMRTLFCECYSRFRTRLLR